MYQGKYLDSLSQYKKIFFISETQLVEELKYPEELPIAVRRSVTIVESRKEIIDMASELKRKYMPLSNYDCLCMAFALIDGYILITDDKTLIKKCCQNNISIKTSEEIIQEFGLETE